MKKQIYVYGTIATIDFSCNNENEIMEKIITFLNKLDDEASIFKTESIISRINEMAGKQEVKASKDILNIIKETLTYSKITNGYLDITTKPVTDVIKSGIFNYDELKEKSKLINYRDIIVNEKDNTIKLKKRGMGIDLGCIAKGYACDSIIAILNENNVENALIDLGGNIYVKGLKNDSKWRVGIQDPFGERYKIIGSIYLSNKSIVTSGNYERPNHIISPLTGYPTNNDIASVSIISDKSIDGEGLSTACYIMSLEEGIKLVKTFKDIDAVFITKDKKVYCTNNIKDTFVLLNTDYVIGG